MKLGIATPVVTNVAGARLTWEQDAGIEAIGRVAETADRLGYHHLTCSEHIGIPATESGRRGSRYWDPLATLGYVSARTEQIRLATMTLVLGYHHPLEIVKRYGTLDHVSGGRVILGVGVGSLKEEFDLIGAEFENRGDRADDALRALRASLASNEPVYAGKYYQFGGLTVDPCALQPHMPIWIGGRTRRSLRRALTLADGWCPFGISLDTAAEWLRAREIPPGFEVVLPADRPLDPVGEPAATVQTLAAMEAAGTTIVSARFNHHSLEHYLEQIHALAELHQRLSRPHLPPRTDAKVPSVMAFWGTFASARRKKRQRVRPGRSGANPRTTCARTNSPTTRASSRFNVADGVLNNEKSIRAYHSPAAATSRSLRTSPVSFAAAR